MKFDMQKFVDGLHEYLRRAFVPVNARVTDMETRLEAMEQHVKDFSYLGVWARGTTYARNNSVTMHGSIWICVVPRTTQCPGDGPDWRLAVKRGAAR